MPYRTTITIDLFTADPPDDISWDGLELMTSCLTDQLCSSNWKKTTEKITVQDLINNDVDPALFDL